MFELSGFDFSEATLDAMFMMADLDGDGAIQLEEGLPYMRAIVMDQGFSVPAPMPELSELSPELLDRYLRNLFAMADENNDGVLQKNEFVKVCDSQLLLWELIVGGATDAAAVRIRVFRIVC